MSDTLVIGIDAGGSKTVALVAGPDGQILGRGRSGPANYQSIGEAAAVSAMNEAVGIALRAAGGEVGQVRALCLGAAGVDRPEDWGLWEHWSAETFPGAALKVTNDALIVLAAGTPAGWGLAVISGTGSIVYGRDEQGRLARAGGWGYLLGDEGSGYAIGQAALRAITQAADGRAPATLLTEAVLQHWELAEPANLVRKVYSDLPRSEIARLGRVVEAVAERGDGVACQILEQAGRDLALAALAVAKRLGLPSPAPCALTGGILVRGRRVRESFLRIASENRLLLEPAIPVDEPAQGAVKLALEEINHREHRGHGEKKRKG